MVREDALARRGGMPTAGHRFHNSATEDDLCDVCPVDVLV